MKYWKPSLLALVAIVGIIAVGSLLRPQAASALALKVQPLSYQETLAKGEKKKAFIDVSNPTSQTIRLRTTVEAFRQTDDQGSLQFYKDERISAGIVPDLTDFSLKAGEKMRLVFMVDGSKLPPGDIFASLMVINATDQQGSLTPAIRVGTLLMLTNGTPGARQAAVTGLSVPFWQFGDQVRGQYVVKNTAPAGTSSGFMPEVTIGLSPLDRNIKNKSSLIFAGRQRPNNFELPTSRFGLYKISASYDGSRQTAWVFIASPLWLVVIGVAVLAVLTVLIARRRKTKIVLFSTKR